MISKSSSYRLSQVLVPLHLELDNAFGAVDSVSVELP